MDVLTVTLIEACILFVGYYYTITLIAYIVLMCR